MTPARPDQTDEIAAFLGLAPERAMFPLSNLLAHGMTGDHPHTMRFWLSRSAGRIAGVLGLTRAGMVLPALPPEQAAAAALALSGLTVAGIVGPADQARAIESATGLGAAPKALSQDEPQFLHDLADLNLPEGPGTLRAMDQAPRPVIERWMTDYHLSTLGTPTDQVKDRVHDWYETTLKAASHRVLMQGDAPLAMTGFNAQLPGIVQIGGVYTPPPLRGRGHARRAVALHLVQARAKGVRQATLFSSSPAAVRAYTAIGFQEIGQWSLILLSSPQVAR